MLASKLVIVWRITAACDLGCHFCAYSRRLRRPRTSADPEQALAFGALLGEYAQLLSRDVLVSWLGGEPLCWPPLFEISRVFKHDFGLRLSATTNGTALASAKVRQHIVELFDELTVSVDGIGSIHDQLRDAPGLFEQLRVNVSELHKLKLQLGRGPRLRVNTILMRDTICDFPRLCETVAGWGVAELTFNALGGRDRPEFFPDHCLWPEQVEWLRGILPGLRARLEPRGLTILGGERYLDRLESAALNLPSPVSDCRPGQSFLFIDEGGFVSPCHFTAHDYGLHLSDLRSAADLRRLPEMFSARRRGRMAEPCFDCKSTQIFGKFAVPQNLLLKPPGLPADGRRRSGKADVARPIRFSACVSAGRELRSE